MVLDSVRTMAIWGISLGVGWQSFDYWQLIGFVVRFASPLCFFTSLLPPHFTFPTPNTTHGPPIPNATQILLSGCVLYNALIRPPCFDYTVVDEQYEALEQSLLGGEEDGGTGEAGLDDSGYGSSEGGMNGSRILNESGEDVDEDEDDQTAVDDFFSPNLSKFTHAHV